MTFKFSLEKLKIIRKSQTLEIQNKLIQLNQKIQKLRTLLESERIAYFHDRDKRNEGAQSGQIDVVHIYDQSLQIHQDRMIQILSEIQAIEKEKRPLEQELMVAKQNEKILEKLEEKRLSQYKDQEFKKEQDQLEEITMAKYYQQSVEKK